MQQKHGLFYPLTNRFGFYTPILYWCGDGLHVALTTTEQMTLLDVVASGDSLRRSRLEKYRQAILDHMRESCIRDRAKFIARYVHREKTGDDAQDIFPAMVVGYQVVHGHACFDYYNARTSWWVEQLLDPPLQETYMVSLVGNPRWPFQKDNLSIGAVLVPMSTIQSVRGSIQNFLLTTDATWIRFSPGGVYVIPKAAGSLVDQRVLEIPIPT